MKIFVDGHIPLMTVRTLRMLGHDVRDIRGTPDEGMQDDALWETAFCQRVVNHSGRLHCEFALGSGRVDRTRRRAA